MTCNSIIVLLWLDLWCIDNNLNGIKHDRTKKINHYDIDIDYIRCNEISISTILIHILFHAN